MPKQLKFFFISLKLIKQIVVLVVPRVVLLHLKHSVYIYAFCRKREEQCHKELIPLDYKSTCTVLVQGIFFLLLKKKERKKSTRQIHGIYSTLKLDSLNRPGILSQSILLTRRVHESMVSFCFWRKGGGGQILDVVPLPIKHLGKKLKEKRENLALFCSFFISFSWCLVDHFFFSVMFFFSALGVGFFLFFSPQHIPFSLVQLLRIQSKSNFFYIKNRWDQTALNP